MFGVLAALILRMTVYKDSLFMNYLTSLLLGLACAVLFLHPAVPQHPEGREAV